MKVLQILVITGILCILSIDINAQADYGCQVRVYVQDSFGNNIKKAKVKHFGRELYYWDNIRSFQTIRLLLLSEIKKAEGIDVGKLEVKAKGFETFKEDVKFWCNRNYLRVTLKKKKSKDIAILEYAKSFYGAVKDENGAVIPTVKVKATDELGKVFESKGNDSGYFRLDLFPQVYKIEFASDGFETFFIDDLAVNNSIENIIEEQNIKLKTLNPEPCGYGGVCEPINSNTELIEISNIKIDTNIVSEPLEKLPKENNNKNKRKNNK